MSVDIAGEKPVSRATYVKQQQLARANMGNKGKIRQSAETLRVIHEAPLHNWADVRELPGTRHVGDIEAKIQTVTQTASGVVTVTMTVPAAAVHRITDIKIATGQKHAFMRVYVVDPGDYTEDRDPENFDDDDDPEYDDAA